MAAIGNTEVYVSSKMRDSSVLGGALPDGNANLPSPMRGKMRMLWLAVDTPVVDARVLTIVSPAGTLNQTLTIPANFNNSTTLSFEIDQNDRANFVQEGESFSVQSDGAGTVFQTVRVVAAIAPA